MSRHTIKKWENSDVQSAISVWQTVDPVGLGVFVVLLTHLPLEKMAAISQTDDIFRYIFLNKNVWISIKISLKFVPRGPINNIPALVQMMVWCRLGDKQLSEPKIA